MMSRSSAIQDPNDRRDRATAAVVTVLFHGILFVVMCVGFSFRYPPEVSVSEIPEDKTEITFEDVVDFQVGGAYTLPVEAMDLEPQLSQGAQAPASPLPAPDPQEIEQQRRDEISRRVRFATNTVDENQGDGGDNAGTTAQPSDINTEVTGLDGFSNEGFPKPSGFSATGTIAINVTVDASGRVIATSHNETHSNGLISNNATAVSACMTAASQSKFKPRPGTNAGSTGVIYYRFKK